MEGHDALHEGLLELDALHFYGRADDGSSVLKHAVENAGVRRWVILTSTELQWREKQEEAPVTTATAPETEEENQQKVEWMLRGLQVAGAVGASERRLLQRAKTGRVHLSWIQEVSAGSEVENSVLVRTANYSITLKAASKQEAEAWRAAVASSLDALRGSFLGSKEDEEAAMEDAKVEDAEQCDKA
eukprot:gb/GFBE01056773.1/.p1 GENE.gb/GFBE01056773.1/~~gb/GFBE01056773.1/.p1  ORF type:complete len:187 (+),score=54.64 gb/GFBE01056773.1/:1-561(+)